MDGGGVYIPPESNVATAYNIEGQAVGEENIRRPIPSGALKTKLCTKFMATGACPYGMSCNFAHGEADLRQSNHITDPDVLAARKQRLCNKHSTPQGCPYGDRCNFAHGAHELVTTGAKQVAAEGPRIPQVTTYAGAAPAVEAPGDMSQAFNAGGMAQPFNFKTKLCNKWQAGICPFGSKCHFAHGNIEIRDRQPLPGGDVPGAPKGDWQETLKYVKAGAPLPASRPPPTAVLAAVAEKLGNGDYAYQANPYGDYFEEGDEQDTNAEEEEDGWLLVDSSPKDAKPTDAIMLEAEVMSPTAGEEKKGRSGIEIGEGELQKA
ncbi:hypothetical protein CYMTET_53837 [Cymbomonas tetramitiformis]|uniref:C3H1-type domain-containing protein n=1 Tax=Cymbomonas tetramitiformis TaxID=36881 RepID=A0AAE0BHJ3_9CHLO|nr:hypothetical protein CYMTET_53837 [Cymbomonas tetramitiformis]